MDHFIRLEILVRETFNNKEYLRVFFFYLEKTNDTKWIFATSQSSA